MPLAAWFIFVLAAVLEVGGDALIRRGLRSGGLTLIVIGFGVLGFYGLTVNMVKWDFSKLLGVYVGVFAIVSVMAGRLLFGESIAVPTWLGLVLIIAGGLVIQLGGR
ncbi:MAG: SMR family transporter [Actinomycetota bacterium]|nr:SMR family transporter [Actinomycetota bacterium]